MTCKSTQEMIEEREKIIKQLLEKAEEFEKMVGTTLKIGNELVDERNMLRRIVRQCDHCLPKFEQLSKPESRG